MKFSTVLMAFVIFFSIGCDSSESNVLLEVKNTELRAANTRLDYLAHLVQDAQGKALMFAATQNIDSLIYYQAYSRGLFVAYQYEFNITYSDKKQ